MNEPLDRVYLNWLYSQIGSVKLKDKSRTYWLLAKQLFTKEFVWIIPNDDNRREDGRDLRLEFIEECEIETVDPEWMKIGCSMLEMMIALSRRLSFQDDTEARGWFWRLIENLELEECTDRNYSPNLERVVDNILDRIIFRTYDFDGHGGLFPLDEPFRDQREVEIWYQMNSYLIEQD